MANPHKGEVDFVVAGKKYVLRFTTNSIVTAEEEFGQPFLQMCSELQDEDKQTIGTFRRVLWVGLLQHHPKITLAQCGDLMDEFGHEEFGAKIGEALERSFQIGSKKRRRARRSRRRAK